MNTIIVTGSAGLIGSESVRFFADKGFHVVGIDNNMRAQFFGKSASTEWNRDLLKNKYGNLYQHYNLDIRDRTKIEKLFKDYSVMVEREVTFPNSTSKPYL
ncbi:MAG: NAD-dependent epimerase/dehydratase family protein, partial [Limnospira sp. PMC 1291.21]|uniref:NAD-dependent epimerase/dehydratase family protein n=1 Tax=unclassified Limnospira TaxID=2642885 RepID=UPI0028E1769B